MITAFLAKVGPHSSGDGERRWGTNKRLSLSLMDQSEERKTLWESVDRAEGTNRLTKSFLHNTCQYKYEMKVPLQ